MHCKKLKKIIFNKKIK